MSTVADIQKQLEELWETAEPGPFGADDAIIFKYTDGTYALRPKAGYNGERDNARVIERAKPKAPEWEAVVASYTEDEEHRRQVFARTDWGKWESTHWYSEADELVDPVPLVEMPERDVLWKTLRRASGVMGVAEAEGVTDAVLDLLRGGA